MNKLDSHPTVLAIRSKSDTVSQTARQTVLAVDEIRRLCLELGADDVGFVSIDRPELDDQRDDILKFFPSTRTLISIVCRMNREPVRNPQRSAANLEFHSTTDHVNHVARDIVRTLEDRGHRAINPSSGFPMEMTDFPGKIWVVSH